jgi:hypothetical protein
MDHPVCFSLKTATLDHGKIKTLFKERISDIISRNETLHLLSERRGIK